MLGKLANCVVNRTFWALQLWADRAGQAKARMRADPHQNTVFGHWLKREYWLVCNRDGMARQLEICTHLTDMPRIQTHSNKSYTNEMSQKVYQNSVWFNMLRAECEVATCINPWNKNCGSHDWLWRMEAKLVSHKDFGAVPSKMVTHTFFSILTTLPRLFSL